MWSDSFAFWICSRPSFVYKKEAFFFCHRREQSEVSQVMVSVCSKAPKFDEILIQQEFDNIQWMEIYLLAIQCLAVLIVDC